MIQDIAPHTFNNEYSTQPPKPESYVFFFCEKKALIKDEGDGKFALPTFRELEADNPDIYTNPTFLFSIDGDSYYMVNQLHDFEGAHDSNYFENAHESGSADNKFESNISDKLHDVENAHESNDTDNKHELNSTGSAHEINNSNNTNSLKFPKGFTLQSVNRIMNMKPKHFAFAALTAQQLYRWYESRVYCGRCGHKLVKNKAARSLDCPSCGQIEYPKIAPAVIIGVTNGDKLLLATYPNFDRYALLAGFAEIGETIEETVIRETMEEVGLKVKNLRYYKSQPWAPGDNLLMGYYCDVDGSDEITIDEEELSGAQWFERKDIPMTGEEYIDVSLTSEMIVRFKEGND